MASGDELEIAKSRGLSQLGRGYKLLDGVAEIGFGPWVDVRTLRPGSVEIFGTFSGAVVLYGSNQDKKPDEAYVGSDLGEPISQPGIVAIKYPLRWLRARVTVFTSGNISAFYHSIT